VGHAHLEGGVVAALKALGDQAVHVHLNDNDGRRSEHAALGAGTIDWAALSPFLRAFPGMLSLEVLNPRDPEGGALQSKQFLEALLAA
jgi:sugar phosphate isomerase/epimerase